MKRSTIIGALVVVGGAIAVAYVQYSRARTAYIRDTLAIEGEVALHMVGEAAKDAYTKQGHFPIGSASPTPQQPCCVSPDHQCAAVTDWETVPIWKGFEIPLSGPTLFQYSYTSDGRTFTATASGDPLCDHHFKTFTIQGSGDGATPSVTYSWPDPSTRAAH